MVFFRYFFLLFEWTSLSTEFATRSNSIALRVLAASVPHNNLFWRGGEKLWQHAQRDGVGLGLVARRKSTHWWKKKGVTGMEKRKRKQKRWRHAGRWGHHGQWGNGYPGRLTFPFKSRMNTADCAAIVWLCLISDPRKHLRKTKYPPVFELNRKNHRRGIIEGCPCFPPGSWVRWIKLPFIFKPLVTLNKLAKASIKDKIK